MATATMMHSSKHPVLFLSHGGGPLPLLADQGHRELIVQLQRIAAIIARPSAIVVVSAHWEAQQPTLTSHAQPPLIYDYQGFPQESYAIQYPAPGNPELAQNLASILNAHGMAPLLDNNRGFDHGVFVPLKILFPEADIPCVQLSLVHSLDAKLHINIGRALAEMPYKNLLIIGSGFSFHNMRAFFAPPTAETTAMNEAFQQWLTDTCANPRLSETERAHRLEQWATAPAARYCHPREEHLLPLHVCYGVAQRACAHVFETTILGKKASAYLWQ